MLRVAKADFGVLDAAEQLEFRRSGLEAIRRQLTQSNQRYEVGTLPLTDIDYVSSASRPSTSVVTVKMELGADPDIALTEVLAKAQEVTGDLPDQSNDPVIARGTGNPKAMMYLAVQHDDVNAEQLTEYIDRVIQPRMSTLPGVAEARILGASEYAMRVWVDPLRLAARGLTATDLSEAIGGANLLAAPGDTDNVYENVYLPKGGDREQAQGASARSGNRSYELRKLSGQPSPRPTHRGCLRALPRATGSGGGHRPGSGPGDYAARETGQARGAGEPLDAPDTAATARQRAVARRLDAHRRSARCGPGTGLTREPS